MELRSLVPSFLRGKNEADPIISTTTLESCINGASKKYEILLTKNNQVIVNADVYGKKQILTLAKDQAKKIQELINSLDISGTFTFRPLPPLLMSFSNPETQLNELARHRKELNQYEEEVKKYAEERKQLPAKREIYFNTRNELFRNLDTFFATKTK